MKMSSGLKLGNKKVKCKCGRIVNIRYERGWNHCKCGKLVMDKAPLKQYDAR